MPWNYPMRTSSDGTVILFAFAIRDCAILSVIGLANWSGCTRQHEKTKEQGIKGVNLAKWIYFFKALILKHI